MNQQLFLLIFLLTNVIYLSAQNLISSEVLGNLTKAEISAFAGGAIQPTNGVNMYKISYTTPDVQGVLDTASGLVLIPDIEGAFPLLAFQHGTVGDKNDVPSNLRGGYQLAAIFGGFSYVTIAPDYLGLGDSRGFHPYVHADTEASAAINMIFATQTLIEQLANTTLNEQLFLTGYSQGGHAAMALHRALETNYSDVLPVTAAAPMSGPYSISGPMRDLILSDQEYFFTGYIPYTALSYQEAYGNIFNEIGDLFKQPYAEEIERFYNHEIDLGVLNQSLISLLVAEFGASIPSKMIQDDVLEAVRNNPDHPINVALRDNDVYDWTPIAPTRLYYCQSDDQVPFRNSIIADSVMNVNGAVDVQAFNVSTDSDHSDCVFPAMTSTLFFFFNFQAVMTETTTLSETLKVRIYPNPAQYQISIECKSSDFSTYHLEILDIRGKQYLSERLKTNDEASIDISHIPNGVYLVKGTTNEGVWTKKLIFNR